MPFARSFLLTSISLIFLVGCGSSGPVVHPVPGKVVMEKGGDLSKVAGATVEFQSTSEPLIRAYGQIKDDGTFIMTTQTGGVAQVGAIPGEHRVRFLFEIEENDDKRTAPKLPINRRFTDFDTSGLKCTVPLTGELVLKVSK